MVVHEHNVKSSFDVAVLEGVIEKDDFCFGMDGFIGDPLYAMASVFVHSHVNERELAFHLAGFIAYLCHSGRVAGEDESF